MTEENKSSTYETVHEHAQSIALRTVPVILKHGERRLQVNFFLEEGSDTSYVNEDVVEELGLDGRKEKVIINVADRQIEGQFNVSNHEDWLGESGWSGGHSHCSENI